jgi:thioredoxin-related protein
MRRHFIFVIVLLLSVSSFSQDWVYDIEDAKSTAKKNNKIIVLVFQGSDWCAPCMKLDKEIFQTEVFKTYATEHFVMLKADFPKRKKNALSEDQEKHNKQLAEKYNKQGHFPYVVVLDDTGKVLGSTGYKKTTPKEYIDLLESFKK